MLLGILRVSSPRLRRPPVETRPPEPLRDSDRLDAATDQNRATKPQPLPPCWSPARATPAPPSPARLSAPGSIAPYDIIVLLFATQIKHKSGTPIHDGALKAEVTFCVQGVLAPPRALPQEAARGVLLSVKNRRFPSSQPRVVDPSGRIPDAGSGSGRSKPGAAAPTAPHRNGAEANWSGCETFPPAAEARNPADARVAGADLRGRGPR